MDGGFANLEAGRPVSDEVSGLGSARGMSKSEAGAAELTGATNKEQEGEEEGGEEEKTKEKTKSVGLYPLLLEFTTPLDIIFMIVGTISSIVVGMTTPYFILVFGDILDGLNGTDIRDVVAGLVTLFAVTGVVALAAGFLAVRSLTSFLFNAQHLCVRATAKQLRTCVTVLWLRTRHSRLTVTPGPSHIFTERSVTRVPGVCNCV
ncbi:unnamed protein product [Discosporangium mesarthrocarpum]